MLRPMDDLDLAIAHLHSAIEHLAPVAQPAAREALANLERARALGSSGDMFALSALTPSELAHLVRSRRESCGLSQRRLSERAGPVSYTHLDVYKRQLLPSFPAIP